MKQALMSQQADLLVDLDKVDLRMSTSFTGRTIPQQLNIIHNFVADSPTCIALTNLMFFVATCEFKHCPDAVRVRHSLIWPLIDDKSYSTSFTPLINTHISKFSDAECDFAAYTPTFVILKVRNMKDLSDKNLQTGIRMVEMLWESLYAIQSFLQETINRYESKDKNFGIKEQFSCGIFGGGGKAYCERAILTCKTYHSFITRFMSAYENLMKIQNIDIEAKKDREKLARDVKRAFESDESSINLFGIKLL